MIVTTGKDRGRQGTILRVLARKDRVVVQGMNVVKKHVKPNQNMSQGGIIDKEMSIHISNVSPVADGKPTRVRFETRENGSKVRLAARTGQQLGDELKKARS